MKKDRYINRSWKYPGMNWHFALKFYNHFLVLSPAKLNNNFSLTKFDIPKMSVNTHWLWIPEDLANTPSVRAGMLQDDENKQRRDGVRMIKEIGKAMNL